MGCSVPNQSLTKKAARTEKRSILTILRKHRGLFTVYYATKTLKRKKASFDCPIDSPLAMVKGMKKIIFNNLFSAGNVLRVQLAFESFLFVCCFSFVRA